jgi:hypothetical protein
MRPRRWVLLFLDPLHFLERQSVGIVDEAARIRQRDRRRAELDQLLGRMSGDIARTRDDRAEPGDVAPFVLEHVVEEVDRAVAGRLGRIIEPPYSRPLPVSTPSHLLVMRLYWPNM